jgi:acetyl esterase
MPDSPAAHPTLADLARGRLARVLSALPPGAQLRLAGGSPRRIDGQTLDPMLQLLLTLRPGGDRARAILDRPLEGRDRLRRDILSVQGHRSPVREVRELEVSGAAGLLRARLYLPEDSAEPPPLLVFYHGGGFVGGDLDTHDEPCRILAHHAGHAVLSVAYRLAPEHRFPAAVDDALAAFEWAAVNARSLGLDPARVAVGGDSAGGNLAAVVAQLGSARGRPPAAQLLIYPPTDQPTPRPSHRLFDEGLILSLSERNAFHEQYAGRAGADAADPRLSPLRAESLRGLPPALVVIAHFDVLRDEAEAYAAALQAAGVRCETHREPALGHGFINITEVCRTARRATVEMATRWRDFADGRPPA